MSNGSVLVRLTNRRIDEILWHFNAENLPKCYTHLVVRFNCILSFVFSVSSTSWQWIIQIVRLFHSQTTIYDEIRRNMPSLFWLRLWSCWSAPHVTHIYFRYFIWNVKCQAHSSVTVMSINIPFIVHVWAKLWPTLCAVRLFETNDWANCRTYLFVNRAWNSITHACAEPAQNGLIFQTLLHLRFGAISISWKVHERVVTTPILNSRSRFMCFFFVSIDCFFMIGIKSK